MFYAFRPSGRELLCRIAQTVADELDAPKKRKAR